MNSKKIKLEPFTFKKKDQNKGSTKIFGYWVYTVFDATDKIIYISYTSNRALTEQNLINKIWYHEVEYVHWDQYNTQNQAIKAANDAKAAELPKFNIKHGFWH